MVSNTQSIPAENAAQKQKNSHVWKRLFALARPEWKSLAWGSLSLALASAAGLAYPQAIRVLLDSSSGSAEHSSVQATELGSMRGASTIFASLNLNVGLWLVVFFTVQAIAGALRFYLFTNSGERVVNRLRGDLYAHLLQQESAFFDTIRTGDLLSRLGSDTTLLQNAVSVNISMALRFLATVVFGVILLFITSWKLALLMMVVVPPVAIGAVLYGQKTRKLAKQTQEAVARANEVAEETLSSIRTVQTFAAEDMERVRYRAAIEQARVLATKRISMSAWFMGFSSWLSFGSASLVLWYGGRLVSQGEMTTGELTQFFVYTMLVAFSLGGITDLWADFNKARGAAERVFELLDRAATIASPSSSTWTPNISVDNNSKHRVSQPNASTALRFENVSFAYPTRPEVEVLKNFSLNVAPGEQIAIVGPSGAGKSTILQLLLRLYENTGGTISLDGQDIRSMNLDALRKRIAVVSQEPVLFSTSIAENIRYGDPNASQAEIERAAKMARADEFIRGFPGGYETKVGERGTQLSGGQKQRIAIARAIVKNPDVLLLDEATSALDAESEHLVKEALNELMKGRTTLIVAHRLSTVRDADRVIVLDQGSVQQSGTHQALSREEGLYQKLIRRQALEMSEGAMTPVAIPHSL